MDQPPTVSEVRLFFSSKRQSLRATAARLALWPLLLPGVLAAQATAPKGVSLPVQVLENELGGPPMANVALGADGANSGSTGALGLFTLLFPKKEPGETVSLVVKKEDYRVVNDIQLEFPLPRRAEKPLVILLCRPAACEEMRRRFYRLKGFEAVEESYQRKIKELEGRSQATASELARLQRERDEARATAERAAEELARSRPGEGSALNKALRFFLEGLTKEALAALDEAKLQASLAAAQERKAEADREIEQVAEGYVLRGQLLALRFQFKEAESAFDKAVAVAPESFDIQFARAMFLQDQNELERARLAYQNSLTLARTQGSQADLASVLNNLGNLHRDEGRRLEARQALEEALEISRELAVTNPTLYRPDLASTLNNLGNLHRDEPQLTEARQAYEEALEIRRDLAVTNPAVYRPDLASTLNNLGVLHRDEGRLLEARKAFEEALEIRRELSVTNPAAYRPDLAMTLNNLGVLHRAGRRPPEARQAYEEASTIYRDLSVTNPAVYRPYLAGTLNNLGILHRAEGRMPEARQTFEEALEIRRSLAAANPSRYRPARADSLFHLSEVEAHNGNLGRAQTLITEAIEILTDLDRQDHGRFSQKLELAQQLSAQLNQGPSEGEEGGVGGAPTTGDHGSNSRESPASPPS